MMIVAVPIGSIVKLVVALAVALVVIVLLLANHDTRDTPGPVNAPSTGNYHAEQ